MRCFHVIVSLSLASLLGACSFHARGPDDYRTATRALLESQNDTIRGCYDAQLEENEKAGGTVVVNFKVESETGKIIEAKVDEANSTAAGPLGQCVVDAISGLTLDPPDARDGHATFSWEFSAG